MASARSLALVFAGFLAPIVPAAHAQEGTGDVDLFIEVIRAALPTARESDLRTNKCDFSSWGGIGTQVCTCTLAASVGCYADGGLTMQQVYGQDKVEQLVFTSVCTSAATGAAEALLAEARQQGEICVARGGTLIHQGAISFLR